MEGPGHIKSGHDDLNNYVSFVCVHTREGRWGGHIHSSEMLPFILEIILDWREEKLCISGKGLKTPQVLIFNANLNH